MSETTDSHDNGRQNAEGQAELRAVRPDEYGLVLDLWGEVWSYGPYFRSYLEGDPWFQDRYCRIAKVDGKVVSCVVICRRPIRHGPRELIMGGIANVSTLPDYRRRGYSGELLRQAVEVMEEDGFHFSTLGTGLHRHYARHGWYLVEVPHMELEVAPETSLPSDLPALSPLTPGEWLEEGPRVYAAFNASLPLCFERSLGYWNGWLRIRAEGWADDERLVLLGLRRGGILEGYLLGSLPGSPDRPMEVREVAALRHADLPAVLAGAARAAQSASVPRIAFRAPRLPGVEQALSEWGTLRIHTSSDTMVRGFHADEFTLQEIRRQYEMGLVAWWRPDDF